MKTKSQLKVELDAVHSRLVARWNWLDANPNHPRFEEREASAIADLKQYEKLCDELKELAA